MMTSSTCFLSSSWSWSGHLGRFDTAQVSEISYKNTFFYYQTLIGIIYLFTFKYNDICLGLRWVLPVILSNKELGECTKTRLFWWLEVFSRGQSGEDLTASVDGTVKPPLHQPAGQAGAQLQGQQAGGGGHWLHHNFHQGEEVNQDRFTEPLLFCTRVREVNRCSRRLWSIQIHIKCSNWSFTLVFQI